MRSQIILHGRRLRLSPTQAGRLSTLLAHPATAVSWTQLRHPGRPESAAALARAISRLRAVLRPHGYDIYAAGGRGFLLAPVSLPLEEPAGKEGH
jgi:DNA-binding response OmpR family regulator